MYLLIFATPSGVSVYRFSAISNPAEEYRKLLKESNYDYYETRCYIIDPKILDGMEVFIPELEDE